MNNIQSVINPRLPFSKMIAMFLLAFFLFLTILPACRVKEGCAASQKGYTNNMERTKKRGKTTLFPKTMAKKIKH